MIVWGKGVKVYQEKGQPFDQELAVNYRSQIKKRIGKSIRLATLSELKIAVEFARAVLNAEIEVPK